MTRAVAAWLGACAAVALLGCEREERRLDPSSPSATPDFPDERPRIYEAHAPAMSGRGTRPPILADLEWS